MHDGLVPLHCIVQRCANNLLDVLLTEASRFLLLSVGPWIQGKRVISLCNERLDLSIGLGTPSAFLHGSILTEEEAERKISSPLLDRLDHGEAATDRRSLQQRCTKLHRVLRHVWHEALHVGDGENGTDGSAGAVPLR